MNRAERRAAKYKKPHVDRNKQVNSEYTLNKIRWLQNYEEEEAASLAVSARMAWYRLTNGLGTVDDFDLMAITVNVTGILCEQIDKSLLEQTQPASIALADMKIRYIKHGKFAPDANALKSVPDLLDLHDQLLPHVSPQKMIDAVEIAIKRIKKGVEDYYESIETRTN